MNLKFWQKKSAPENEEAEASGRPGLLARLVARLKRPKPFTAETSEGAASESEAAPEGEAAAIEPNKAKRIGLIAGGVALLVSLLIALGFAAWKIMQDSPDPDAQPLELIESTEVPPPLDLPASEAASAVAESAVPQTTVPADAPVSAPHSTTMDAEHPAPQEEHEALPPHSTVTPAAPQSTEPHKAGAKQPDAQAAETTPDAKDAEIAELRKKNAELQKQLEAQRAKERSASKVRMYPGRSGPVAGGSVTVESSDPKATASTLKDAIDAMNSGDARRKTEPRPGQPEKEVPHGQ